MAGKVDVLSATIGTYPEGTKVVQFTKPYAGLQIVLLVRKSQKIEKLEDAAKRRIGLPRGAAQDSAITKDLPASTDIRRFDDHSAMVQALVTGQVDAIRANTSYIANINKIRPNNEFERKLVFNSQFMGVATKSGDKNLNA